MIHYEGFFITEELPHTLARNIEKKHITTEYKPAKTNDSLYGITADFEIIGYGNDGVNEGYKVRLVKIYAQDEQVAILKDLYDQIPVPHITLSLAEGAKAVNTCYLDFKPTESRIVSGIFRGEL